MANYTVTDTDGTKLTLSGDSPPTEQELTQIFSANKTKTQTTNAGIVSDYQQRKQATSEGSQSGVIPTIAGDVKGAYDFVNKSIFPKETFEHQLTRSTQETMRAESVSPQSAQEELSYTPKKLPVVEGVAAGIDTLAGGFTSPLAIATLGMGSLPVAAQKAISLAFAAQMISQAPEQARQLGTEFGKPPEQRDTRKIAQLITEGAGTVGFAYLAAKHGLTPEKSLTPLTDTAVKQAVETKGEQNAQAIRSDTGQSGEARAQSQGGEANRGSNVQQTSSGPSDATAQKTQDVKPDYQYASPESKAWWEKLDELKAAQQAAEPGTPEYAAARKAKNAHEDLAYEGDKSLARRRVDKNDPLEGVNAVASEYSPSIGKMNLTGWKFNGEWEVNEDGRGFRRVVGPKGERAIVWRDTLHPVEEAALEKNTASGTEKVTDIQNVRPAIKTMDGNIVVGAKGDVHDDIIANNGLTTKDIDSRLFVDANGNEISREQLAQMGVNSDKPVEGAHASDLGDAQKAQESQPKEPWQMTKEEYQATEPKPDGKRDILIADLGHKKLPIIKNPTSEDYAMLTERHYKEFPDDTSGDPKTRFTIDSKGNRYVWPATEAMHSEVESWLKEKGIIANQNTQFFVS